ncbi:conjugated bile salt MFS transporter [Intestinibacter bartlettii]|uniref:Conjugated bile salt MFS transporter n=1 Tax=Intestinibacter bartlettii TaxID=261299 RepID=A0ABS6DUW0_9FIRM|nr:conjugated bile salt MFS transporter [Intestinibacter bartlettii]MBU5335591.1 conjugated bile salt MFS transporter [Intestinibacter bartlettii]
MENTNTKKPFFYGWIIVVACMLIQAVPYGIATNVQPQFINFVTSAEGFTLTQFSLLFTIGTIVSAIASPYIGKILSDPKTNIKLVYIIGSILCGGGFALFSLAGGNLWAYYGISALVQVGTSIVSAIGVPLLLNAWFKENKGLAMGLAFSGSGIGNIFLQQAAARLLSNPNYGYAKAYLIFGIISLVVSLIISIFLVRLPKGESELAANVPRKKAKTENNSKTALTRWGYTLKEVTKMKLFWVLAIAFIFVGFYVSGMSVQYTSYLYKLGFSATYVANIGSIFALFSILGNLSGGLFFDKLGIKKTLLLSGIMVILCGLCLVFIPNIPALGYLFAVLLGITIFAYILGPSYLTGALFGDREFGTILGIVQVFFAIGYALGTVLFGMSVDTFGYATSWVITTIYAAIAYGCLLIASIGIIKYNKEQNVTETKKIV